MPWCISLGQRLSKSHRYNVFLLNCLQFHIFWSQSYPTALPYACAAGLAAGFDKDAAAVKGLLGLGFGFVEVGKHVVGCVLP